MSSAVKALRLLSHFSATRPEIGLSQLCRIAGRDKSTTYRYLQALETAGFIEQNSTTKQYRLGPALLQLAQVREETIPRKDGAKSALSILAGATGETAHVTVLSGKTLYGLCDCEPPKNGIRAVIDLNIFPLHATASGLCALAFGPTELFEVAAASLEKFTETTPIDEGSLISNVKSVRTSGFGYANQSYEAEIQGVSAPLFDHHGLAGTVAVACVASRFSRDIEQTIKSELVIAARDITRSWGGKIPPQIEGFMGPYTLIFERIGTRIMKDSNFLKENNGRLMWHPMTSPQDSTDNPPKIITGSDGVSITDIDGHRVVDGVGGLWNVNLGYSCQPVKDAISKQLETLPYYSTFRGTTNDVSIELSFELSEFFALDGLSRAFFTSGGSDSVETSLRLARQYHKLRGEAGRTKFLSLKKGYHGTHIGGASVNGNANFRNAYEPLLPGCFHIPAPYTYRNPFNEMDPVKLAQLCLQALEDEIAFQGANTIAAMIMEPILGAGGVIPPHHTFAPAVQEICNRNGILLITDEVITAYGRTGAWSGARLWGIQPDMMATAKAITNGYFPFGAVMLGERMIDVFEGNPDAKIGHGYTYSGHPVGAAAALACLAETKRLNVIKNAAARGTQIYDGCMELMKKYKVIGDVRGGYGLMTAIEMVSDRSTKKPIDEGTAKTVQEVTYQNGAMVRVSGPNLILSPPLVLSEADATTILTSLDAGFSAI